MKLSYICLPIGVIAVLVSSMQLYKFHAGMKRRIFDRLIGLSGPCHPFNK